MPQDDHSPRLAATDQAVGMGETYVILVNPTPPPVWHALAFCVVLTVANSREYCS